MQDRSPADRDPEVLSEPAAARLLARASELEELRRSGSTVAELRAAAAEAGISASAFDAALTELQETRQAALSVVRKPARRLSRLAAFAATGMIALVFASRMLFPGSGDAAAPTRLIVQEIRLRCISPGEAAALVKPLLGENWNNVSYGSANPSVLTIRATQSQLSQVTRELDRYERESSAACRTGPATTAAP